MERYTGCGLEGGAETVWAGQLHAGWGLGSVGQVCYGLCSIILGKSLKDCCGSFRKQVSYSIVLERLPYTISYWLAVMNRDRQQASSMPISWENAIPKATPAMIPMLVSMKLVTRS